MKLGIMQPYFFPYIGYFQLIQASDRFILFDVPQYERRGWMNRNRIINLKEGSTYISVATVKAPQKTALNKILLAPGDEWKKKILAQLDVYRKLAPNYAATTELVRDVLNGDCRTLAELNAISLRKTCAFLGIERELEVLSEMNMTVPDDCAPDEWALNITKALGYKEYVNAPGGGAFFDADKYRAAGIELKFIQPRLTPYVQRIGRWEPGLSIIDVMMFNSPEEIQAMLTRYDL